MEEEKTVFHAHLVWFWFYPEGDQRIVLVQKIGSGLSHQVRVSLLMQPGECHRVGWGFILIGLRRKTLFRPLYRIERSVRLWIFIYVNYSQVALVNVKFIFPLNKFILVVLLILCFLVTLYFMPWFFFFFHFCVFSYMISWKNYNWWLLQQNYFIAYLIILNMDWNAENKVDLRVWFNQRNMVKITECSVMIGLVDFKIATCNSHNTLHIPKLHIAFYLE